MFYLNRRNSMKRVLAITLFLVSITAVLYADDPNTPYHPQVSIMTSKGEIVVELRPEKAPKTVRISLNMSIPDFTRTPYSTGLSKVS
jgi:hypothetical protein